MRISDWSSDVCSSDLTAATKSNGISISMPWWDDRVAEIGKQYPDVRWDKFHIDILCAHFVQRPDYFDVVVASNLFGDILSDLGDRKSVVKGKSVSVRVALGGRRINKKKQ